MQCRDHCETSTPEPCAQARPGPTPPSSAAAGLQPGRGLHAFSMLAAAGTQERKDTSYHSCARRASGSPPALASFILTVIWRFWESLGLGL